MRNSKMRRKLKVIEASGAPHEIGVQYGEALRANIRKTFDLFYEEYHVREEIRTSAPDLADKYVPFVQAYSPHTIEMINGIAEGAKLDYREVLFVNVAGFAEHWGCTSFAATGEATVDGETIVGQNADWRPWIEDLWVILKAKPSESPSYLALTFPGLVGGYGLNSAGVGWSGNSLCYGSPAGIPFIGSPMWRIIQNKTLESENLGKAILSTTSAMRLGPSSLPETLQGEIGTMLASREGDIVYVEPTWNDYEVLFPKRNLLTHANHYETERFKSIDMVGRLGGASTYVRSNRLRTLMEKHYGEISVEVMKELLSDHGNYPTSICAHVDEKAPPHTRGKTVGSFICHLREQKMYFAIGNPCENKYVEYRL